MTNPVPREETKTSYRVVDQQRPWRVVYAESLKRAKAFAAAQKEPHRIETRTVTYSPWEVVADA